MKKQTVFKPAGGVLFLIFTHRRRHSFAQKDAAGGAKGKSMRKCLLHGLPLLPFCAVFLRKYAVAFLNNMIYLIC